MSHRGAQRQVKLKRKVAKTSAYKAAVARQVSGNKRMDRLTARREATYVVPLHISEKKNIDSNVSALTTASPPGWNNLGSQDDVARPTVCLNACSSGALATQRVGRRIRMTSLFIRAQGWVPAAMTGQAFFRLVIVYDKECNTSTPNSSQLLTPATAIGMAVLGNGKRFKVLADICHPTAYSADTTEGFLFDRYIKLNHETTYIDGAGAGTAADIVSGGLFAIGWWGGSSCGGGDPTIKINFRVRYTDN